MELAPKILLYISRFSVLVPIFFLFKGKQNFTGLTHPVLKGLGLLLLISAFSDLLSYILFKTGGSNLMVGNSYIVAQFFLLNYIYSLIFKNRVLIYIGFVLFTGFFIINIAFIQPFTEFQGWSNTVGSIILLGYSTACFIKIIKYPFEDERFDDLILWINIGVSLYFFMNLYLFASTSYIFKNESADIAILAWSFHNFINIVKNILFATGIYYAGRKMVSVK